ncbi:mediator of RNA polymerase II transcription subunit 9 isoform X1 [Hypanus sabinus]|uniref:mediator of RNA polymerase II transcription subunit 9 isoform X1 n=1 Tax=Hypanus sabinus TaxID=79690 RepID=UPI0028C40F81|nr:mediator of RNA polymerase II transcription subunit 9 isoform X1 [Hypanus sabinus]
MTFVSATVDDAAAGGSARWRPWRRRLTWRIARSCRMDKDSQEVHQELNKLKTKLQDTREAVSSMPGIDVSPEQQQQQLQNLRDQVRTKNELLQKYRSLCMFDIPKA